MQKTILITGSTDGIGLATARSLVRQGHHVLLHGRNPSKLAAVALELSDLPGDGRVESFQADLSSIAGVECLARSVADGRRSLDVLINNAGVFGAPDPVTVDGLDVRFAVNTIAPYLLTRRLLPLLGAGGRVVNLSSAAQAPVNLDALRGEVGLSDNAAYAQSKLALTMWTRSLAQELGDQGPAVIAVNPGSLLATKMVKSAYGMDGADISIGVDILSRAALDEAFASASGKYFDNDSGRFAPPHADGLDDRRIAALMDAMESVLAGKTGE